jgi:tight adherence protein B
MTEMTRFLLILAISAALGGWAIAQLVMGLRRWENRRLQKRLAADMRSDLDPVSASPVLTNRPQDNLKALVEKIPQLLTLNATLQRVWPGMHLRKFLTFCGAFAVMGMATGHYVIDNIGASVVLFLLGGYTPVLLLNMVNGKRKRMLNDQLVDALEFLSRVLRAGHSLSTGISMLSEELPNPIAAEFRATYDQTTLGLPMETALTEMAERVESTDFAFFVTAVLIQRQTGGDLAEILDNIGGMIRNRIRLQQHVKALTAEGRLSGYILSAFPIVMFCITWVLNPEYASTLVKTQLGQIALVIAAAMTCLGLFLIRKIVSISI